MPPFALSIRSAYVALTLHYVNSETLLPEGWFMLFRQDCGPCLLHEQKGQPWKKDCVCMDLFPQHVLLQCHVWGWPSQTAAIKSPKGRRNDHCARVKKKHMFSGWNSKKYQLLKRKKLLCRLRAGGLGLLLLLQVVTSTRSGTWRWSPARLQVAAKPFALPLPSFSVGVLRYASGSLTPSATFRSSATRVHEGISGKPSFFPGSLMLAQCRLLLGVFFHFDRQLFGLSPCGAAVGQAVRQLTLESNPGCPSRLKPAALIHEPALRTMYTLFPAHGSFGLESLLLSRKISLYLRGLRGRVEPHQGKDHAKLMKVCSGTVLSANGYSHCMVESCHAHARWTQMK